MPTQQFRVWFGSRAASVDELRRIEAIQVTQEMDAFWEAQLRLVLCLDAQGAWQHWPGDSAAPFSRVRVELDIGDGRFQPLIDGPLVSIDADLDAQPGRSTATMLVRDDSAFLHIDEAVEAPFEHRSDSAIAEELFGRFPQIQSQRIAGTALTPETTTRRGTVLQFLRDLARANDRHAYVLPGEAPGASIGCFLPDPADAVTLPPLVLIGAHRNLASASVTQDPDGGERTQAQLLRTDDQGVTTFETGSAELGLLGALPARPADLTPRRLLHPADNTRADPAAAAAAQARRRSRVYQLRSQVMPGCYAAVLTPYQKVRVDAGATPYSGDYLITKVVHHISASLYTQDLEARSDSASVAATNGPAALAAAAQGIF